MAEVLIGVVVVLVLASLAALVHKKRQEVPRGTVPPTYSQTPPIPPTPAPRTPSTTPDQHPPPATPALSLALLPLPGDGTTFLALGDVTQLQPSTMESTSLLSRPAVERAAADIVVSLNLPLQVVNGLQQSSNLVRLAPETMKALQNGAKFMESGGKATGVLRGTDGRIVELVRFTSVSSAVSIAASLGNALALAAIQMQLNQISKKLDVLSGQLERIAEADEHERLAQVESLAMSVQHALGQCSAAGYVPDQVMNSIAGQAQDLDAHIRRLEKDIRGHLARVPGTGRAADQMEWLARDGLPGVNELDQMLVAMQGWLIHQGLYAANLGNSGLPAEIAAQARVIEQTIERRAQLEELVRNLAYEIDRALHVAEIAPGQIPKSEWTMRLIDKRSSSTSERVRDTASRLRASLRSAGILRREIPPLPQAESLGVDSEPDNSDWRDMLRYRLRDGEQPLLYVHGSGVGGHNNTSRAASVMVFTDQRVLGIRKSSFAKRGVFAVDKERDTIKGARISKIGIGRFPVPGRALRVDFDGGAADIELTGTDDNDRARIEARAVAALAHTTPAVAREEDARPREVEGLPVL